MRFSNFGKLMFVYLCITVVCIKLWQRGLKFPSCLISTLAAANELFNAIFYDGTI